MTSRVPIATLVCVVFVLAGCSSLPPTDKASMPDIEPVGMIDMPEQLDGGWQPREGDADAEKDAVNISRAYDLVAAASVVYFRDSTEVRVRAVEAQSPLYFTHHSDTEHHATLIGDVSCLLSGTAATCMRTSTNLTLWIGPLDGPAEKTAALVESTWAALGGGPSVAWPVGMGSSIQLPQTLGTLVAFGSVPQTEPAGTEIATAIEMDVAALSDAFGGAPAAEQVYGDSEGATKVVATAVGSTAPDTYVPYVDADELGLLAAPLERITPADGTASCLVRNETVPVEGDPDDLDPVVVWCERIGDGMTVRIDQVDGDMSSDIQTVKQLTDELYVAVTG